MKTYLFYLLQSYLGHTVSEYSDIGHCNWRDLLKQSSQQGIYAIVWDTICKLVNDGKFASNQLPDKTLKLQWALGAEKIKSRYNKQKLLANKLSDAFVENDINTYVLKGLAISGY